MRILPFSPHQPIIEMDTNDAVWEWRVISDKLCISRGAQRMLGMEENTPESMHALLAACHDDSLP